MKISEHLIQMTDNAAILASQAAEVNIRLFRSNKQYRNVILEIVRYMDEHLHSTFEDYTDPRGVAAPNLGFPFRIIGYKKRDGCQFCINPKIVLFSLATTTTQGNSGSLRLETPLSIERAVCIDLQYYDLEGTEVLKKSIGRNEGSFTIQNEVDQINGITVIERHRRQQEQNVPNPNHHM